MIDTIKALAYGARLIARHRGDLTAVQAHLDADRDWAKFCARHDLAADPRPER